MIFLVSLRCQDPGEGALNSIFTLPRSYARRLLIRQRLLDVMLRTDSSMFNARYRDNVEVSVYDTVFDLRAKDDAVYGRDRLIQMPPDFRPPRRANGMCILDTVMAREGIVWTVGTPERPWHTPVFSYALMATVAKEDRVLPGGHLLTMPRFCPELTPSEIRRLARVAEVTPACVRELMDTANQPVVTKTGTGRLELRRVVKAANRFKRYLRRSCSCVSL
jgi:hypothetical protein